MGTRHEAQMLQHRGTWLERGETHGMQKTASCVCCSTDWAVQTPQRRRLEPMQAHSIEDPPAAVQNSVVSRSALDRRSYGQPVIGSEPVQNSLSSAVAPRLDS